MLVAYLDESGIDRASATLWVGGFAAHSVTWFEVSRLWRHALIRHEAPSLHMVELAGGRGAFAGWDEPRRRDLLDELIGILTSHDVVGVGAAVDKAAYQRIIIDSGFLKSTRLTHPWWKTPYLVPFQDCLVEWLAASRDLPRSETLSLVAEEQREFRARAVAVFDQVRDFPRIPGPNRLASMTFVPKAAAVPLQAADLLVYELRKGYDRTLQGSSRPPRIPLRRLATRVRSARVYDADTLPTFIEAYRELFEREVVAT